MAYSIQIHQFIFVFLVALPFGILVKVGWLTPLVTMLVAFPILALDEIGVELQNPFSTANLNHLPLDEICENLERNLMSLVRRGGDLPHGISGPAAGQEGRRNLRQCRTASRRDATAAAMR